MLNLLGHGEPAQQSVSPVVFPKLQDFVWQKLVFVLTSHLGQAARVAGSFHLSDLARMVTMHGPKLFDPDHRQPYKYFQLLLLCGRFERAINYLAKHAGHGDLTPAVHFALALHHYGALRTRPGPAVVQAMRVQQAPGGGVALAMGDGAGAGAGAGSGAGGRLPAMSPALGLHGSSSSLMPGGHGHGDTASGLSLPGSSATLDAFLWLVRRCVACGVEGTPERCAPHHTTPLTLACVPLCLYACVAQPGRGWREQGGAGGDGAASRPE